MHTTTKVSEKSRNTCYYFAMWFVQVPYNIMPNWFLCMQMDGKIHICFDLLSAKKAILVLLIDHMSFYQKWQEKGNRNPYQEYLIQCVPFSEWLEVDLSCNLFIVHDVISPINEYIDTSFVMFLKLIKN